MVRKPYAERRVINGVMQETCEYCGFELGVTPREEHPCYVVDKAATSVPQQINSIALIMNGYPGYALVIPDGSGYATALSFILAVTEKFPKKFWFKALSAQIALAISVGAVLGALVVYIATAL